MPTSYQIQPNFLVATDNNKDKEVHRPEEHTIAHPTNTPKNILEEIVAKPPVGLGVV